MRITDILKRLAIKLKKSYPFLYTFLAARISTKRFAGLPLTILTVIFLFNAFLLSEIVKSVINSEILVKVDHSVAELFFKSRIPFFARIFYFITQAGNIKVIAILALVFSVLLVIRKRLMVLFTLWVTIVGSVLTVLAGKHTFKINRPYEYSYYHENLFSFPSGHASISMAFYGLIAYYLIRESHTLKVKSRIFIATLVLILLIGFSRIYLCVHFLSDVLGGYFFGFLWLLLAISFYEWYEDKQKYKIKHPF